MKAVDFAPGVPARRRRRGARRRGPRRSRDRRGGPSRRPALDDHARGAAGDGRPARPRADEGQRLRGHRRGRRHHERDRRRPRRRERRHLLPARPRGRARAATTRRSPSSARTASGSSSRSSRRRRRRASGRLRSRSTARSWRSSAPTRRCGRWRRVEAAGGRRSGARRTCSTDRPSPPSSTRSAKAHGRIDVLVHAGGIEISRKLSEKEAKEFDLVFDIKADGFFSPAARGRGPAARRDRGLQLRGRSLRQRRPDGLQLGERAPVRDVERPASRAARDPRDRDRLDGLGRHRHGDPRLDPADHGRGRHLDAPARVGHPDRPARAGGGRRLRRAGRRRHARHHGRRVRRDGRPRRREGARPRSRSGSGRC